MTEHSPLPWKVERPEPPNEGWCFVLDSNGKAVCYGAQGDMEMIARIVNTLQMPVEALEECNLFFRSLFVVNKGTYKSLEEMKDIVKAALEAAKEQNE